MKKEEWKRLAAKGALELEELVNAEIIGVGTGSTVAHLIDLFPSNIIQRKLFVASSMDTALKLKGRGAKVMDASALDSLDIYIDGADAVDWEGNAIKGGGAALFREKVLASMSKFFTIIIDEEKLVKDLRERPLPVEVDPFALSFVVRKIEELGMSAFIRQAKEGKQGPIFSDSCRVIVDVDIRNWGEDLEKLNAELKRIPGILETGLFIGMADVILIGGEGGIARRPGGRRVRKGS